MWGVGGIYLALVLSESFVVLSDWPRMGAKQGVLKAVTDTLQIRVYYFRSAH